MAFPKGFSSAWYGLAEPVVGRNLPANERIGSRGFGNGLPFAANGSRAAVSVSGLRPGTWGFAKNSEGRPTTGIG